MTATQVLTGYKKLKDNELLALSGTVGKAMGEDNPYFATPQPTLAELQTAQEDFAVKLQISQRRGSPFDTSLKNDSRDALLLVLKRLAFYVNVTANGSLPILLSSGFRLAATQVSAVVPTIPERLKLRDGRQSGQMIFTFDAVKGATLYEYQYAEASETGGEVEWGNRLTTSSSTQNLLAPLTPGRTYLVRVRAMNGAGIGDWSEPVSLIAR
ncbi:Fibronectin type III domain-containing protein [bacterium A37T11]|nr:Fibronectin type III domain-containing protein [bacterium A37T11]